MEGAVVEIRLFFISENQKQRRNESMNERELRQLLAKLQGEYTELRDSNADLEQLKSKAEEIREAREKLDLEIEMRAKTFPPVDEPEERKTNEPVEVRGLSEDELDKEYEGVFLRAFRGVKLSQRDHDVFNRMKELRDAPSATPYFQSEVAANGGLIVPKAVSTLINTYKRELEFDLTTLVDVQVTNVLSGSFVYEKLSAMTPFAKVNQWGTISEVTAPQFEGKEWKIEKYAGILPIPNELLQDSDQNLMAFIAKWIARKTVVTRNFKIMGVITSTYTTKTAVADSDAVKDILNVTLDRVFNATASIVTNQDGFNWLDKLKDAEGRYLLQTDVQDPTKRRLFGKLIHVLPNNILATATKKVPIYFGDFKEAIRFYDRGLYEITSTNIGGKSYERDSTDVRVIERFDVVLIDSAAVVAGEITLK